MNFLKNIFFFFVLGVTFQIDGLFFKAEILKLSFSFLFHFISLPLYEDDAHHNQKEKAVLPGL